MDRSEVDEGIKRLFQPVSENPAPTVRPDRDFLIASLAAKDAFPDEIALEVFQQKQEDQDGACLTSISPVFLQCALSDYAGLYQKVMNFRPKEKPRSVFGLCSIEDGWRFARGKHLVFRQGLYVLGMIPTRCASDGEYRTLLFEKTRHAILIKAVKFSELSEKDEYHLLFRVLS